MARSQFSPPTTSAVLPAIIIGGSILAGGWMVDRSVDRASAEISGKLEQTQGALTAITAKLDDTKGALEQVAQAKPAAPRRRGPDPNKRYTVASKGAPTKGPATAKVKIFEFSDFQ